MLTRITALLTRFNIPRSAFTRAGAKRMAHEYAGTLILLSIIFAVGLMGLVFIEIADEVIEREADPIDRAILAWLRADEPPRWVLDLVRDITALGSAVVLTLWVAITALFLALCGRYRACAFVVLAAGAGTVMSTVMKVLFDRARPDLIAHDLHISTASFPSGHAMLSAVVYLTLGALIAELVRPHWLKLYVVAVAAFLTGLVGSSRVYLGVHWPTDVLAGWAAGAAWAIGTWGLARFVFNIDQKPASR